MEIKPFCSVGVLEFGDIREDVRAKLNSEYSSFVKNQSFDENETDAFDRLGLHLYYDDEGKLEFVEAFESADITFQGVHFLGREVMLVTADMEALGFQDVDSDTGLMFPDAGIALTVAEGIIEGIAAYRAGYYD